jgi:hypothetical protein
MKKYLLKITAIALFIGVIVGCESDNVMYGGEQALAAFVKDVASLPVDEAGVSSIKIGVEVSTVSTTDRTIVVSVDPKSTILATQYKLDAATLVIPAGSYLGEIVVTGNFNNLVANQTVTLFLNLDSVGDATLEKNGKAFELLVYKSCPSDLAGTYSVLSSGSSTDSGPTPAENPITNFPYTVVITAKGSGAYSMSDGYGGLYRLWYDIYGITKNYPGTFNDVCNTLSGTFAEPFGTDVNITGKVNANGTLTIRWENGYGDFGVGTYTKQ